MEILVLDVTGATQEKSKIDINARDRTHIRDVLDLDAPSLVKDAVKSKKADEVLSELIRIYHSSIKPLEDVYHFADVSDYQITGIEG